MAPLALLALTLVGQANAPAKPRIVQATAFKNGYAFVTREIAVNSVGEVKVPIKVTNPSQGTFWYKSSDGLAVKSVSVAYLKSNTADVPNGIDELIDRNVGSEVQIELKFDKDRPPLNSVRETIQGKMTAATGEYLVVFNGNVSRIIPRDRIYSFSIQGQNLTAIDSEQAAEATITFRTEGKPGTIQYVSLEYGLTWTPTYRIDLLENDRFAITSKANIFNQLDDLKETSVRFVTGNPNLPNLGMIDPLFARAIEEFSGPRGYGYGGMAGGGIMAPNMNGFLRGGASQFGGGPFRDGFGGVNEMIAFESGTGYGTENLYFYELSKLTAPFRATTSTPLFSGGGTFTRKYQSYVTVSGAGSTSPVDTLLELDYSGQNPLSSGQAAIFVRDDLTGQTAVPFTPRKGKLTVTSSKALDISVKTTNEESGRDKSALKLRNQIYDLVATRSTVTIENGKDVEIDLQLSGNINGEFRGGDYQPTIQRHSLEQVQQSTTLTWKLKVKPKSKLVFSFNTRGYQYVETVKG